MQTSNTIPLITAFKNSPDRGRGMARDMRVRWALEEIGQPYEVQLVTFEEMKQADYRNLQPFAQIPAYKEDDLILFESGAIILYLADKRPGLFPADKNARARAIMWMFSALNTVEPPIIEREAFRLAESNESFAVENTNKLKIVRSPTSQQRD